MASAEMCCKHSGHPPQVDDLMQLRRWFEAFAPLLQGVRPLFKMDVIIDANVVIRDLIRQARPRHREERSWIQELCAAGTLVAHAPSVLDAEVRRNLPRIAKERHISIRRMLAQWEVYSRSIAFVDVPNPTETFDASTRDPDDLPYIWLQQMTGGLIYTNDKDISAMGGRTIGYTVIAHLRDYSRHAVVEYTIKCHGRILVVIGGDFVRATYGFLRCLSGHAKKVPCWIWLVGGGGILLAFLHPRVRQTVSSLMFTLSPKARKFGSALLDVTEPLMVRYFEAKTNADRALENALLEIEKSAGQKLKHPPATDKSTRRINTPTSLSTNSTA